MDLIGKVEKNLLSNFSHLIQTFDHEFLSTFLSFAKQRNVLLDDENIRFDICQAFAVEKSPNVLNFESFLFQDTEKPTSAPESYEIEGNKIRFCCPGINNPKNQLEKINNNFENSLKGIDKDFDTEISKLQKQKRRMDKKFDRKSSQCLYTALKNVM